MGTAVMAWAAVLAVPAPVRLWSRLLGNGGGGGCVGAKVVCRPHQLNDGLILCVAICTTCDMCA